MTGGNSPSRLAYSFARSRSTVPSYRSPFWFSSTMERGTVPIALLSSFRSCLAGSTPLGFSVLPDRRVLAASADMALSEILVGSASVAPPAGSVTVLLIGALPTSFLVLLSAVPFVSPSLSSVVFFCNQATCDPGPFRAARASSISALLIPSAGAKVRTSPLTLYCTVSGLAGSSGRRV